MKTAASTWIAALLVLLPGAAPAGEPEPLPGGKDFGAGLSLYRRGVLPTAAVRALASRYFERLLPLSQTDWGGDE